MAIARRFNWYSGIRCDIPFLRSIESAVSYDIDTILRGVITGINQPYLIRGFDIVIPAASINASALQIQVANSVILHSTAAESGTILVVPPDTPDDTLDSSINSKVIGGFTNGTVNYIALDYRRSVDASTVDQTFAWSPSQKIEYQRAAPLGQILDYRYIITNNGFGTLLPLYKIKLDQNGNVEYIVKAVPSLFRLGRGGSVPDPTYKFNFKNLINPQTITTSSAGTYREWIKSSAENPVTVEPGDSPLAFHYGDWSITSLKEWMDAVMTRIADISGSQYWYIDSAFQSGTLGLFDLWWDSVGNVMTGAGNLTFNYILESSIPLYGGFQTSTIDKDILSDDSYVVDTQTGSQATLNTFNYGTLIIHSLTNTTWAPDDNAPTLHNRRIWRLNNLLFQVKALWRDDDYLYAYVTRTSQQVGNSIGIVSWSYDANNLVTITTDGNHSFKAGDFVDISGLVLTGNSNENPEPNGIQYVLSVPSDTTFTFQCAWPLSGTPSAAAAIATQELNRTSHPYNPTLLIKEWTYESNTVTLTVQNLYANPNDQINILVKGLQWKNNPAQEAPNGGYLATVTTDGKLTYTYNSGIQDEPSFDDSTIPTIKLIKPYDFLLTVNGATPTVYNVTDITATTYSPVSFSYPIGPKDLTLSTDASGAIRFDGVVARSKILNPLLIEKIEYITPPPPQDEPYILITLFNTHGRTGVISGAVFTIYGDPETGYAKTYTNATIDYSIDTNKIKLSESPEIEDYGVYNHNDNTPLYAGFPGNPYPGPIQWDSDIVIKGIIGDKAFTIPKTATATPPLANKFNVGGVTGTVFLQDGEVAYIVLERNQLVSQGLSASCQLSSASKPVIIIPGTPLDINNQSLEKGDFIKFTDEPENYWLRIGDLVQGVGNTTVIHLLTDAGLPPTQEQRPLRQGSLVYCKGTYSLIYAQPHWKVTNNPNIYWVAVRRDNNGPLPKCYLKALELTVGETRAISNQVSNNLLIYTGAMTEGAVEPNYEYSVTEEPFNYVSDLTIESIDIPTRTISLQASPVQGLQKNDILKQSDNTYTIHEVLTSKTVVLRESINNLTTGNVTYYRRNYNILNSDNLTSAIRKEDRELARLNTNVTKTVYDESVYCELIELEGSSTTIIHSGDFIYQGNDPYEPTAIAWVLHGNDNDNLTIENRQILMPGGQFGSTFLLINCVRGTWDVNETIKQNGVDTGWYPKTSNDQFVAPAIPTNTEIVLPPNRRLQSLNGNRYIYFPPDSVYTATSHTDMTGEDLLVIINDTVREAGVDYSETFGGPKAKIKILRDLPPKTRIRFRVLSTMGSAAISLVGYSNLQEAYNLGHTIVTRPGTPVVIHAGNAYTSAGDDALYLAGRLIINGDNNQGNIVGGLFPHQDKKMLIGSEQSKPLESWSASEYIKTHNSFSGSAWCHKTAATVTTDANGIRISDSAIDIPAGTAIRLTITAVARHALNNGSAAFRVEAMCKRDDINDAVLVGYPVTTIIGAEGNGDDYAVTVEVDNNIVYVTVYGTDQELDNTVYWAITEDYQIIRTST